VQRVWRSFRQWAQARLSTQPLHLAWAYLETLGPALRVEQPMHQLHLSENLAALLGAEFPHQRIT